MRLTLFQMVMVSLSLLSVLVTGCSAKAETSTTGEVVVVTSGEPDGVLACPRGAINEEYPGKCSLYQDENNDRICDLSQ